MKRISITWTETATYTQTFAVDDDFDYDIDKDLEGGNNAVGVICEEGDHDKSFVSVDERDVISIEVLP